jgi:hypothetical protein
MKNLNKELLINVVIMLAIGTLAFCAGYAVRQGEVLQNAKQVLKQDKLYFDVYDIQRIIFN